MGICPEKILQDGLTLTVEQNVLFQGRICPEKLQLDQIQNGWLVAIIDLIRVISGKPCHIAKPLYLNYKTRSAVSEKDMPAKMSIQNGWIVAIIVFNMRNIWKTFTVKQNVQLQGGIYGQSPPLQDFPTSYY